MNPPHYDRKNRTPPNQKGWEPHPDEKCEEYLRGYGAGWDDSGEFTRRRLHDLWPLVAFVLGGLCALIALAVLAETL